VYRTEHTELTQVAQWLQRGNPRVDSPTGPVVNRAAEGTVVVQSRDNANADVGGNKNPDKAWVKVPRNPETKDEMQLCEVYGVGGQIIKFRAGRTAVSVADSMRSANRMFGGWIERDGNRLPQSDKVEAGVRYVFVGGERLGT
jgi:hypothetical protein